MMNISPLNSEQIEQLFQNGKCLSFHWVWNRDAMTYGMQTLPQKFPKRSFRITSKQSIFATDNNRFHYFDNGLLLYICNQPEGLEQMEQLIKAKGYPLNQTQAVLNLLDFQSIEKYATAHYDYKEDITALINIKTDEDIDDLFKNNNICISADKTSGIHPEMRQYMALFADGRLILSDDTRLDSHKFLEFEKKNPQYIYLNAQYTKPEVLQKIYQKAQTYSWYSSEQEALEIYQQKQPEISDSQNQKEIPEEIKQLITANKCLTVNNGRILFNEENVYPLIHCLPDTYHYALFADGRVIIAEPTVKSMSDAYKNMLLEKLHKLYPDIELQAEIKPLRYVETIYEALLDVQPSAKEEYLEFVKQKIKKIKRTLKIPHHEALEICAQMLNWKSWKDILNMSEPQARQQILTEKINRKEAEIQGYDLTDHQLEIFIKNKHLK